MAAGQRSARTRSKLARREKRGGLSAAAATLVAKLRRICGEAADEDACGTAIELHDGDIDRSVKALIVSGHTDTKSLDPELASDEQFALAAIRDRICRGERLNKPAQKRWGI